MPLGTSYTGAHAMRQAPEWARNRGGRPSAERGAAPQLPFPLLPPTSRTSPFPLAGGVQPAAPGRGTLPAGSFMDLSGDIGRGGTSAGPAYIPPPGTTRMPTMTGPVGQSFTPVTPPTPQRISTPGGQSFTPGVGGLLPGGLTSAQVAAQPKGPGQPNYWNAPGNPGAAGALPAAFQAQSAADPTGANDPGFARWMDLWRTVGLNDPSSHGARTPYTASISLTPEFIATGTPYVSYLDWERNNPNYPGWGTT